MRESRLPLILSILLAGGESDRARAKPTYRCLTGVPGKVRAPEPAIRAARSACRR